MNPPPDQVPRAHIARLELEGTCHLATLILLVSSRACDGMRYLGMLICIPLLVAGYSSSIPQSNGDNDKAETCSYASAILGDILYDSHILFFAYAHSPNLSKFMVQ